MPDTLMTSKAVRDRFGGISDMTLWRWLQDPALAFPQPVYVRRRRYWRASDLDAWQAARAANDNAPVTRAA